MSETVKALPVRIGQDGPEAPDGCVLVFVHGPVLAPIGPVAARLFGDACKIDGGWCGWLPHPDALEFLNDAASHYAVGAKLPKWTYDDDDEDEDEDEDDLSENVAEWKATRGLIGLPDRGRKRYWLAEVLPHAMRLSTSQAGGKFSLVETFEGNVYGFQQLREELEDAQTEAATLRRRQAANPPAAT